MRTSSYLHMSFIALLLLSATGISEAQDASSTPSVSELVSGAKHGNHEKAKKALFEISKRPISTPDETVSVYEAMKVVSDHLEDGTEADKDASWGRIIVELSRQLSGSVNPEQQEQVLKMLAQEADAIPTTAASINGNSPGVQARENIRVKRLEALCDAVSAAHNPKALPILRRIVKEHPKSIEARYVEAKIGSIGDPADLQARIAQIKADPSHPIDLSNFGPMIIQPLAQELGKPNLTKQQRGVLLNALGQARSHNAINEYATLLNSADPEIQKVASVRIAGFATKEDAPLIRSMLQSNSTQVRYSAVNAISQQLFTDEYVPDLIHMLQSDPDEMVRALVASTLGNHRVKSADAVLRDAQHDRAKRVRDEAQFALKRIHGEVSY